LAVVLSGEPASAKFPGKVSQIYWLLSSGNQAVVRAKPGRIKIKKQKGKKDEKESTDLHIGFGDNRNFHLLHLHCDLYPRIPYCLAYFGI
jgi:hypothetical protein